MRNITNSAWNSSDIIRTPQFCKGSGWAIDSNDQGSGYYLSCSTDKTPSVRLSFTGRAVYYISYYFTNQTIQIVLDGVYKKNVTLSPPKGAPATNDSHVLWSMMGLLNVEHTLEIFPATGTTLIVDTIIYTVEEPVPSLSPPSTTSTTISNAPSATQSASSSNLGTVGLVTGTIVGSLCSLILLGLFVMVYWRKRKSNCRHSTNDLLNASQQTKEHRITFNEPLSSPAYPTQSSPIIRQPVTLQPPQSPHSQSSRDNPERSGWYVESIDQPNRHSSWYSRWNYPKLEPLRKVLYRT